MDGSGNAVTFDWFFFTVCFQMYFQRKWMDVSGSQDMQMEGSGNTVTEQFLVAICLSSQRTPVQHDTQVDILKKTNFSKTF